MNMSRLPQFSMLGKRFQQALSTVNRATHQHIVSEHTNKCMLHGRKSVFLSA